MVARLSKWIELSFWQMVVRVLSGAQPLSHGLYKIQRSVSTQPFGKVISNGWTIAALGWFIGLILGIWISGWI